MTAKNSYTTWDLLGLSKVALKKEAVICLSNRGDMLLFIVQTEAGAREFSDWFACFDYVNGL